MATKKISGNMLIAQSGGPTMVINQSLSGLTLAPVGDVDFFLLWAKAGRFYQGDYLNPGTYITETGSSYFPYFKPDKGGSCQQAFTILFTDGYYNGGAPSIGNADGDNSHPPYDGGAPRCRRYHLSLTPCQRVF